jgi:hypothetical protein
VQDVSSQYGEGTRRVQLVRGRDETCPLSTGGGGRRARASISWSSARAASPGTKPLYTHPLSRRSRRSATYAGSPPASRRSGMCARCSAALPNLPRAPDDSAPVGAQRPPRQFRWAERATSFPSEWKARPPHAPTPVRTAPGHSGALAGATARRSSLRRRASAPRLPRADDPPPHPRPRPRAAGAARAAGPRGAARRLRRSPPRKAVAPPGCAARLRLPRRAAAAAAAAARGTRSSAARRLQPPVSGA